MRTTLDIELQLLKALRREALHRKIPVKHLVNRLLRQALNERPVTPTAPYHLPTFDMGLPLPGVNLDKALAIAAELEDEEMLREMHLRK